ncbi:MAG: FAD-dependent oxidoreductase, partial [Microbacteriaceae bacterium]
MNDDFRVVVVGGGVAGLVAARDCARPGISVTVLEATDAFGGQVAAREVAGIRLDTGAESYAIRGGHVATLLAELGLESAIVSPNPAGAWVALPDVTVPLPKTGLLGIPGSPLATDVIAAIGWRGALRAYLDRLMPVLKIGQEENFGALVRRRMGNRVVERLVAPITTGVYSAHPDQLEVAAIAPGLNPALTRQGSLSGAVTELRAAAKAGSGVAGVSGGMSRLVDALHDDLIARGAQLRTGAPVAHLWKSSAPDAVPAGDGRVATADDAVPEHSPHGADDWRVQLADGTTIDADAVVIATGATTALGLLAGIPDRRSNESDTPRIPPASTEPADPAEPAEPAEPAGLAELSGLPGLPGLAELAGLDWPAPTSVEIVTLVVDAPQLDSAPRGTGVLVAPVTRATAAPGAAASGTAAPGAATSGAAASGAAAPGSGLSRAVSAKALTHASAKWPWVAELAGPGRHVLRLSYGSAAQADSTGGLDDAAMTTLALRDASILLGLVAQKTPLAASAVVGVARTRWMNAVPFATLGQRARLRRVREAVEKVDGLELVGAWL